MGIAFVATVASSLAYAEPGSPGQDFSDDRFAELDTNGDGRITLNEVEAQIASDFAGADGDGDGTLSEEEATAFHQARHEERRERRRERRGGDDRFSHHAGDDGVIDQDEFAERGMQRFEMADLDENGSVTQTEMQLVAQAMGDRRGRHHGRRHSRDD